jgi:DnaJ family protein A protein 1
MYQQIQTVCRDCDGNGERINPKDMCKTCQGHKIVKERKILEVHIDKGMEDGQKITFYGEGDQVPGLEPGDIVIVLEEKEHALFKRRDMDLFMKMDISLTEALCGFRRPIKTLDNRTVVITSHAGEVIKTGETKCVLNEGMPMHKNPFEKGRLIITFNVTFPENGEIAANKIEELERLLPPRPQIVVPTDAEEHVLADIDPSYRRGGRGGGRGGMMDEDMDEDGGMPGGRRVQCANQ